MSWVDILALALGLAVCVMLAYLISPLATQSDPTMDWEGRVAVGFAALLYIVPLWLAQGASTLFVTLADGGIWPGWLWGWLVLAPLLGISPPAAALARGSSRAFRRRAPSRHLSGTTVQQASNFAWADTVADPGWELRRTPPLLLAWPPPRGGAAVWFCYAERPAGETVEVAGPWAQIIVADRDQEPVVERLSDAVESVGSQSIQPAGKSVKQKVLLTALRGGDPDGVLARALNEWRARNPLVAAHSTVAQHLPPVA